MEDYTRREMPRFLPKTKPLNNGCRERTPTINRKGFGKAGSRTQAMLLHTLASRAMNR